MEKNKIKVLMITARADYGGGPEHIYQLICHLPQNIEVWMACPGDLPYWDRYVNILGNERLFQIPHRRFTIKSLLSLKRFVKKHGFQFIHSHGKGAGLYGRIVGLLTNCPCIHTFHGIHIGEYGFLKKLLYINLERIFSRWSKFLIAVSPSEFSVIKSLNLCNPGKLVLIENGVRLPNKIVDKANYYEAPKSIYCITRFDFAKNTGLAIEVIQILLKSGIDDFQLNLIGDGPERVNLEKHVSDYHLTEYIKFNGFVSSPLEYMQNGFCYLSTSRWEGLPLGLLEAMSIGLPVVASNVTGNKDVINNEVNGFLFELKSPETAARFITKLRNEPMTWENISKAAREKVANQHSVEKMASKTAELYSNKNWE